MKELTGYVALIDVLGFSSMMSRPDARAALDRYTDCVSAASSAVDADTLPIEYVVFSDSILLNTNRDSEEHLLALLRACGILFSSLLEKGIPIRGAVAHGSFMRYRTSERGVILAGGPILEAYAAERAQKWIGVILCPSVYAQQPNLKARTALPTVHGPTDVRDVIGRMPWPMLLNLYSSIPFQEVESQAPSPYEGYVLLPVKGIPAGIHPDLQAAHTHLTRMKTLAPGPRAQVRYRETLRWLEGVIDGWAAVTGTEWWQTWLREAG
jgi:hypothetical protein